MPTPPLFDVLVIGSGLAGLGVAHNLALAGKSVAILEREDPSLANPLPPRYRPASRTAASYKNAGMLNILKPFRTVTNAWQTATLNAFIQLGVPVSRCGMSMLVDSALESAAVNVAMTRLRGETLRQFVRVREPNILPQTAVFHDPEGACANPEVAMRVLREAVQKEGVQFLYEPQPISAMRQDAVGVFTVEANGLQVRSKQLVLAAGPFTKDLLREFFRLDIAVQKVLGIITELVHDEPEELWFRGLIMGGHSAFAWGLHSVLEQTRLVRNEIEVTRAQNDSRAFTTHLYMSHAGAAKRIYVGGPRIELNEDYCEADLDPAKYEKDIEASLKYARRLVRFPSSVRRIGTWSGLMAFSQDDYPFVGPVDQVPGLFLCTGFASAGFREAFGGGAFLADLMLAGSVGFSIDPADLQSKADWHRVLPAHRVVRLPAASSSSSSSKPEARL